MKAWEVQNRWISTSITAFFNFFFISSFLVGCSQPIAGTSNLQKAVVDEPSNSIGRSDIIPHRSANQFSGALNQYGPLVRKYSGQYGMDWVLVMAVMKQESRFDHEAVSHRGAYGLMQIMPMTQVELSEKLGINETLTPRNNIKAGVFHLRQLYDVFSHASHEDRIKLMLAAYNGGVGRVFDAQRVAKSLGDDPNSWSAVRAALPLLGKSSYSLHRTIWEEGIPAAGYFRNWRETADYVDAVTQNFEEYTVALR
jgi:membrane-bound lytic murein transglycosylase F